MIELLNGKTVEASGDTVEEALWELKRNRPGDHIYPVIEEGSTVITAVDVRSGDPGKDGYGEMAVTRLKVVTK